MRSSLWVMLQKSIPFCHFCYTYIHTYPANSVALPPPMTHPVYHLRLICHRPPPMTHPIITLDPPTTYSLRPCLSIAPHTLPNSHRTSLQRGHVSKVTCAEVQASCASTYFWRDWAHFQWLCSRPAPSHLEEDPTPKCSLPPFSCVYNNGRVREDRGGEGAKGKGRRAQALDIPFTEAPPHITTHTANIPYRSPGLPVR